jgi:hypothetical protein
LGWFHAESHFKVARNLKVAASLLSQREEVERGLL